MFEVIVLRIILGLLIFNTVMILYVNKSVVRIEGILQTRRQPRAATSTIAGEGEVG